MRYIMLDSLGRKGYISPLWTEDNLEMVSKASKFISVASFSETLELWSPKASENNVVDTIM